MMLRGGHLRHSNAASAHSNALTAPKYSSIAILPCPKRAKAYLCIYARVADLRFRKAQREDIPVLRRMIFQERMNPLGINAERFTVATDEQGSLLGFGQLEPKDGCVELRSMVVDASHRRQGIGRRVLRKLLEEAAGREVVMTTITSRIPFYAAEGFERLQLKDVPRFLLFEVVAGTAVARIAAGEELVVLRRRANQ